MKDRHHVEVSSSSAQWDESIVYSFKSFICEAYSVVYPVVRKCILGVLFCTQDEGGRATPHPALDETCRLFADINNTNNSYSFTY